MHNGSVSGNHQIAAADNFYRRVDIAVSQIQGHIQPKLTDFLAATDHHHAHFIGELTEPFNERGDLMTAEILIC